MSPGPESGLDQPLGQAGEGHEPDIVLDGLNAAIGLDNPDDQHVHLGDEAPDININK